MKWNNLELLYIMNILINHAALAVNQKKEVKPPFGIASFLFPLTMGAAAGFLTALIAVKMSRFVPWRRRAYRRPRRRPPFD
jgi:hypothetical protein